MKRRTKYYIVAAVAVLIIVIGIVARGGGKGPTFQSAALQKQDLKRTVLATGTVTSNINLALSFRASGIVQRIPVKVGQKVKAGDILAQLSAQSEAASVTQARGAVAAAEASLAKVLAGSTSEEVAIAQYAVTSAQVALDNAKRSLADTKQQQDTAVANAYKSLLNSTPTAYPKGNNIGTAPVISGTYTSSETGSYVISFSGAGDGLHFMASGLESAEGRAASGSVSPLGARGLYISFPGTNYAGDTWVVDIPNARAVTYVTNLNAYNGAVDSRQTSVTAAQNAVASAQAALDQAVASLNAKKAEARPADVQAAQAQVLSAQGQLAAASAQFENTIIRAPAAGTITSVDVKVGEQATALKSVIGLQDVGSLYVEANISEANIAQVAVGQPVSYTFDALGPEKKFTGTVTTIDPASTVVSGVVNYKVTASVNEVGEARPGMTANMSVLVGQRSSALAVPQRALVEKSGQTFVRVITDQKKGTFIETGVVTGLEADGGLVEVKNGLTEGQTIITYLEEKK